MPHFKAFGMINLQYEIIISTTPYFEHTASLTYSLWGITLMLLQLLCIDWLKEFVLESKSNLKIMTELQCLLDFNDSGRYHTYLSREHLFFIPAIVSILIQSQHCSKVNSSKDQLISNGRFSVIVLTIKLAIFFQDFLP